METEEGATIADVINQYYAWDKKGESFPWNSNPKKTDKRRNSYELANTFLDVDPELSQWVENNWPLLNGREGDEYCSLNKGDLIGTGIVPPAAPGGLNAMAVSDRQINLTWTDNSENEECFFIQRKSGASSYFSLGKVDSNVTSFDDNLFLSANTTYTYRVKAVMGLSNSTYSNEASATTFESNTGINRNIDDDALPDETQLKQNYPNPFNPRTTIHYTVAGEIQEVSLVVYDMCGQQVKTLVNQTQLAGHYKVEWDGTDSNGRKVASGLYSYRLIAGESQLTCYMTLVK
jgi:hypothetical protein